MKLLFNMPDIERHVIETLGIPGVLLMENAGRQVAEAVLWRVGLGKHAANIIILCGPGQNGGDGLVAARHLSHHPNLHITVVTITDLSQTMGDTATNAQLLHHYPITVKQLNDNAPWQHWLAEADIIVDAVFGTGLSRPIEGLWAKVFQYLNAQKTPVISVDIPSGINANTGSSLIDPLTTSKDGLSGSALHATETVTFEAARPGHVLGQGRTATGKLTVVPIGMPPHIIQQAPSPLEALTPAEAIAAMPTLPTAAHKYQRGLVGVVVGPQNMAGAPVLASMGALHSGAGMVAALGSKLHHIAFPPECVQLTVEHPAQLLEALKTKPFQSLLIGPGLGTTPEAADWLQATIAAAHHLEIPLILDADGLNLLANARSNGQPLSLPHFCILTPHTGEAARLLNLKSETLQTDLYNAACQLQTVYGVTAVVLKSASTVVVDAEHQGVVPLAGNAGLGTAGTGDVLAGLTAGLAAQQIPLAQAAWLAALWHGHTADILAQQQTPQGITASLLAQHLPHALAHWQTLANKH